MSEESTAKVPTTPEQFSNNSRAVTLIRLGGEGSPKAQRRAPRRRRGLPPPWYKQVVLLFGYLFAVGDASLRYNDIHNYLLIIKQLED